MSSFIDLDSPSSTPIDLLRAYINSPTGNHRTTGTHRTTSNHRTTGKTCRRFSPTYKSRTTCKTRRRFPHYSPTGSTSWQYPPYSPEWSDRNLDGMLNLERTYNMKDPKILDQWRLRKKFRAEAARDELNKMLSRLNGTTIRYVRDGPVNRIKKRMEALGAFKTATSKGDIIDYEMPAEDPRSRKRTKRSRKRTKCSRKRTKRSRKRAKRSRKRTKRS